MNSKVKSQNSKREISFFEFWLFLRDFSGESPRRYCKWVYEEIPCRRDLAAKCFKFTITASPPAFQNCSDCLL